MGTAIKLALASIGLAIAGVAMIIGGIAVIVIDLARNVISLPAEIRKNYGELVSESARSDQGPTLHERRRAEREKSLWSRSSL